MQARQNVRRIAFVLAAAATVLGVGIAAAPKSASAQDCTPQCYKHPITGQLICTYPCP
jgi:hypothetical protein